jgi:hypothetical protein
MGVGIGGQLRGILANRPRIVDFRMAPKSGHFTGFSGTGCGESRAV